MKLSLNHLFNPVCRSANYRSFSRCGTAAPGCAVALLLASFASATYGAEMAVKTVEKEPPAELASAIRETLAPSALQLLEDDELVFEFWFRREVPLQSEPSSPHDTLKPIAETTLVGALLVHPGGDTDNDDQPISNLRTYRDDDIVAGLYTLRMGIQPVNGDHLGTSEFPYYLLLIPHEKDTELGGLSTYDELVEASGEDTVTEHPGILSLRPLASPEGELPRLTEPLDYHKCIRLALNGKAAASEIPLIFDLVYDGVGEF